MKRILLLAFTAFVFSANAQKITKDSLLKIMCGEMCDELTKKAKANKKIESLETEIGLIMLPSITKHSKEIEDVYGENPFEGKIMETVGEDLGGKLAADCPAFLTLFTNNSEATAELISGKKSDKVSGTVKGSFVKITNTELSFIEIKTSNGKIEKLYWMEYFEGSNDLMNTPLKFNNKNVTAKYVEKEIYKSTLKDYSKIKVITSIALD